MALAAMDALGAGAGSPAAMKQHWCVITCEYPPIAGGVSDHTFQLAGALADAGDAVEVWTPPAAGVRAERPGIDVHVLPSRFGFDSLRVLRRALSKCPATTRVLVQYVPTAFGWRMMNVGFALMLATQRRGVEFYVHEVGFPIEQQRTLRRKIVGVVHLLMNWMSMRSATRIFVTIPDWASRLRALGVWAGRREPPITWIPVPSNIPAIAASDSVREVRAMFGAAGATMIGGHFGIFGRYHSRVLPPVIFRLLDGMKSFGFLLIGRNSDVMRDAMLAQRPDLASRIVATGGLPPAEASANIAACDVMLQPYEDGASSRRTSLMAALALGRPIVTNRGVATDAVWTDGDAVSLTDSDAPAALTDAVHAILRDRGIGVRLGAAALALDRRVFSLARSVSVLRDGVSAPSAAREDSQ